MAYNRRSGAGGTDIDLGSLAFHGREMEEFDEYISTLPPKNQVRLAMFQNHVRLTSNNIILDSEDSLGSSWYTMDSLRQNA